MSYNTPKEGWQDFILLCTKIKSADEFSQLFDLFFTIEEKETLASRFQIIKAILAEASTQREIAETHKVSIAQITRGSNAMKIISPEMRARLKKLLN
ncbi:MAG: trp operon repressor [Parachlamydiaceae bacterium]|nr:trp operon repressor [Parachlamydiaceae bacterium]